VDPFLIPLLLVVAGVASAPGTGAPGVVPTSGPPSSGRSSPLPWQVTQADVLEAVRSGRAEFAFVELPGAPGVFVTADALKVDGIRVPVTARTTQAVCDFLGCHPTTPAVEDMIQGAATVPVVPPTEDWRTMQTEAAVRHFNSRIDEQVAGRAGLVSCVGKSWVLSNAELDHPGRAVNYGMFRPDGPYNSVSGRFRLWQQPSWAHNPDHWDYSQTCRLVRLDPGAVLPAHEPLRVQRLWV